MQSRDRSWLQVRKLLSPHATGNGAQSALRVAHMVSRDLEGSCRIMCMALAEHLGLSSLTPSEWAGLARERGALPSDALGLSRNAGGQGPLLGPSWPIWKRLRITTSPPGLSASRRRTRRGLGEGSRIIPDTQRLDLRNEPRARRRRARAASLVGPGGLAQRPQRNQDRPHQARRALSSAKYRSRAHPRVPL